MQPHPLHLIGYASSLAGVDAGVGGGPLTIQQSTLLRSNIIWDTIFSIPDVSKKNIDLALQQVCQSLAIHISRLIQQQHKFCVIGGDHTSALGTWSGAYDAFHAEGDIGLIWLDAHMDSHTPETTQTGRIHGMPLAALLGYGYPSLTNILHPAPKLKPENVCLIGVRSFEHGERDLLQRLNVRVYFMEEINARGFQAVWDEAIKQVKTHTIGYGISFDLDCLDPLEVPAVDVPEPNGLCANDVKIALQNTVSDPYFFGAEIVEFNPSRDKNQLTEKWILDYLKILAQGD